MDKIATYRQYIKEIILGHSDYQRIHACLIHVDLKGEKIWIQRDGIEAGITQEFLARGVPKQDIVQVFHAPYKRKYTEYSVA